ncbi:nuclear transport factor 2 family protein [Tenacibaculum soleae]|uniref:nuclear transport factor 2 family protein n=1 Tax=Tenacibaculum soleae TaxID=447689 RepID=UPI002301EE4E|nr:nuclear transport factor 2 family protein [Tenacibaculum soleae]
MKYLLYMMSFLSFSLVFSQASKSDDKLDERQLLINIYGNQNSKKVINYDKSFVSESKIFYESFEKKNSMQSPDKERVKLTLKNYIEGSSYNNIEQLERVFTENATLYLTVGGEFKSLTPKEYVAFFKDAEKGKFNGRYGKVLSIEVVKDIATAKVEISIPERKMIYIDLLLLKKSENNWKIISNTVTRVDGN